MVQQFFRGDSTCEGVADRNRAQHQTETIGFEKAS
jgi:hypothetical protein